MKKHDFGAWFLLCELLFLFAPGVSAMAEETEPLFAFAAQAEEVRPGGSFAVTCTPARGDIGAVPIFALGAVFRHVTRFRRPAGRGLRCAREPQKSRRGRQHGRF